MYNSTEQGVFHQTYLSNFEDRRTFKIKYYISSMKKTESVFVNCSGLNVELSLVCNFFLG